MMFVHCMSRTTHVRQENHMYSIANYGEMITDNVRMQAFDEALRLAIRPGSVVVDIGTGFGYFALLACKLGARKVYAIEPDDSINLGREFASANGCADTIEFIQRLSTDAVLPEKADVVFSDMRGVLPLFQQHLPSIADARERFLADGGTLIARRDTLWATIVETRKYHPATSGPWIENRHSIDMQPALPYLTNTWCKAHFTPEHVLADPCCWAGIDYSTVSKPGIAGDADLTVQRAGTAHGIAIWFDTDLIDRIGFSNAPGQLEVIYGNAFFPFTEPVEVAEGDKVRLKLRADLVGDDYAWSWDSSIVAKDDPGRVTAGFRQSTLFGAPLSLSRLAKRSSDYAPRLSENGRIDRLVLELMAEEVSLGEISSRLAAQFPHRFPTPQKALSHVGDLSLKYDRE